MSSPARPVLVPLSKQRLPVLDGLRGIAVLLVMLHHMTVMLPKTPVDAAFADLVHLGRIGVDLFFVLSGFLITGILWDSKSQPRYFRNFYARRALRIFPLYYAVVAFSLLLLPHIPHPKLANFSRIQGDELWYWFMASNFIMAYRAEARHGILDVTWSLAIEEQFYLIWPWVVARANRLALMRACVLLVVVGLLLRVFLYTKGTHWFTIYTLTPCRMDGLAAGAFLALAARAEGGLAALARPARWLLTASGAALIAIYLHEGVSDEHAGPLAQCVGYSLVAVFFAATLAVALTASPERRLPKLLGSPAFTFLGTYSYGLYLVHLPLRALVRDAFYGPRQFATVLGTQIPAQLLFYGVATAISIVVAFISYHYFEKQFLGLKRHFESRAEATVPA